MGDQRRVDALLQQGLNYKYDRHGYYWYADYGTELRDRALILSLLLENQQLPEKQPDLQMQLSDLMQSQGYLSTQERNALFMAARHSIAQPEADWQASVLQSQQPVAELSNKTQQTYNLNDESILKGVTVASTAENPLYLRADVTGYPQTKPKPAENGVHITREIFDLQGKIPNLKSAESG